MQTAAFCLAAAMACCALGQPVAHRDEAFQVNCTTDVQYAQAVICTGQKSTIPGFPASKTCPGPTLLNLTLDLYQPLGKSNALRPAFVATHSGGYSGGDSTGYKAEMKAACEFFAARGYVAISMNYRLAGQQRLAPVNWTTDEGELHPLLSVLTCFLFSSFCCLQCMPRPIGKGALIRAPNPSIPPCETPRLQSVGSVRMPLR